MRGIVNIVIGAVMIVGGLSGKLALRGTDSGIALAVVGAVIVVFGIVRVVMHAREKAAAPTEETEGSDQG